MPRKKTKAAAGTYVPVRDLPRIVQKALKSAGFNKKDIEVIPADKTNLQVVPFEGSRGFNIMVDLARNKIASEQGSWGGANPYEKRLTDNDRTSRPLPDNVLHIKGESGGRGTFARIYVNPKTLAPLLPQQADISENEKKALGIVKGIKSGYRADAFKRNGLGKYSIDNPLIQGLLEKGLLKKNARGSIMITTDGKNAAGGARFSSSKVKAHRLSADAIRDQIEDMLKAAQSLFKRTKRGGPVEDLLAKKLKQSGLGKLELDARHDNAFLIFKTKDGKEAGRLAFYDEQPDQMFLSVSGPGGFSGELSNPRQLKKAAADLASQFRSGSLQRIKTPTGEKVGQSINLGGGIVLYLGLGSNSPVLGLGVSAPAKLTPEAKKHGKKFGRGLFFSTKDNAHYIPLHLNPKALKPFIKKSGVYQGHYTQEHVDEVANNILNPEPFDITEFFPGLDLGGSADGGLLDFGITTFSEDPGLPVDHEALEDNREALSNAAQGARFSSAWRGPPPGGMDLRKDNPRSTLARDLKTMEELAQIYRDEKKGFWLASLATAVKKGKLKQAKAAFKSLERSKRHSEDFISLTHLMPPQVLDLILSASTVGMLKPVRADVSAAAGEKPIVRRKSADNKSVLGWEDRTITGALGMFIRGMPQKPMPEQAFWATLDDAELYNLSELPVYAQVASKMAKRGGRLDLLKLRAAVEKKLGRPVRASAGSKTSAAKASPTGTSVRKWVRIDCKDKSLQIASHHGAYGFTEDFRNGNYMVQVAPTGKRVMAPAHCLKEQISPDLKEVAKVLQGHPPGKPDSQLQKDFLSYLRAVASGKQPRSSETSGGRTAAARLLNSKKWAKGVA